MPTGGACHQQKQRSTIRAHQRDDNGHPLRRRQSPAAMVATLVPDALQAAILPHILRLSNELLREILDHIESDPEKLINVDRRNYLSQESFKPPPRSPPNTAQTIGHFRLTCRKFSELGAVHQFARVTTRFSRHGFTRLDNIASAPHLAKHVKKFSYMVPYFYVEGASSR